ncbi:4'-phosphopantetheinyl transferase family protein [Actinophytocola glycyrrhizae]|uniref:4'-phosphopantetheinyl transferase family protein n=1 Tax=Actinophytocola glycyrrhizae TaxID=2044873 RepID=A0ABV9S6F2_9PSEU
MHVVDLAETLVAAHGAVADLPDAELAMVARYRGAPRRAQATVSRLLTRAVAGHALRTPPRAVEVTVDGWGRPSVTGSPHTNISHDGGLVVLVSGSGPCGVDVEDTAESDLRGLVGRFCGVDEVPVSARQSWTAKESAAKAIGRGLRAGLATIRFQDDPGAGWAPVTWRGDRMPLRTRAVDLGARHLALTVSARAVAPTVRVSVWRPARAHGRWWLAEAEKAPAALAAVSRTLTSELSQERR